MKAKEDEAFQEAKKLVSKTRQRSKKVNQETRSRARRKADPGSADKPPDPADH